MLTYICAVIGVVLVIVGFIEIYKFVNLLVFHTKKEKTSMIIVPISDHNEEAELLLRSAAAKVKWMDEFKDKGIICLDCGMDEETRRICENIVESYSFMEFKTIKDFEKTNSIENLEGRVEK